VVELKDIVEDLKSKGKSSSKGKGLLSKSSKKVGDMFQCQSCRNHVFSLGKKRSHNSGDSDSESESGTADRIDGKRVKSNTTKSALQWVSQLQKDNSCKKHHGHACIKFGDGRHYQLTMADLSNWFIYLVCLTLLSVIDVLIRYPPDEW